ncbi:hypothetical protein TRICI_003473 [Trichomonascus ciferrii]|uniref:nitric oxide dioxygenase n=1 Tax=Trichomonascus ciferrii TaxID=44093 RepID=A0A642V8U8_9ASCO|nr:hypothetical protein TRICI_003473 [Trichomonascus ciferrii]
MPLTQDQVAIIKATVPILETRGDEITKHFYTKMLDENETVRPFFNSTHQQDFAQPKALAGALLAYAKNIENLEALGGLVERIVQKHCSLNVLPEHYPIVGKYLLNALVEILGKDVANDDVIAAWDAAYQALADILIEAEGNVYDANEQAHGGWRGYRDFRVAMKVPEAENVISFYLKPVDDKPILTPQPGQYLGFKFSMESGDVYTRQYSISHEFLENEPYYRISIKRIPGGLISKFFHDQVREGDVIQVTPPYGELILDEKNTTDPVVMIGAGIGVTPLVAMTPKAVAAGRDVTFVQCDRDPAHQPFAKFFEEMKQKPNFHYKGFFSNKSVELPANSVNERLNKDNLKAIMDQYKGDTDIYLVGPPPFMHDVRKYFSEFANDKLHVHYEFFGPTTE